MLSVAAMTVRIKVVICDPRAWEVLGVVSAAMRISRALIRGRIRPSLSRRARGTSAMLRNAVTIMTVPTTPAH